MPGSLIAAAARTPIGKLMGSLAGFTPMELAGAAIGEALRRAGLKPDQVEHVLVGQVLQAGHGQVTARQAAAAAGIPLSVPGMTINKACLSGLNAIHLADQMVAAGEAEVVVAGGMESMTQAPYLVPGARAGFRMGDASLLDSMTSDGLTCAFDHLSMGAATDRYNRRVGISRERQDVFAAGSHEKAAAAAKAGRLREEIVPITAPSRRGDPIEIDSDEGIRPETTPESLSVLRPAFDPEGTITAGNASQLSDGAAAVVVVSPRRAEQLGVTPLGEIVGYGQVAGPDPSLHYQPSRAIRRALDKAGISTGDVDLFEINEAFAAVVLASVDDLDVPEDLVNVNGGAIALGHPIGMSGTRIALTALYELRRRKGSIAVAGLCGAGGQGDAIVLRSVR